MPESAPQVAAPFGKYLLLKRLAVGGMAELFLAKDTFTRELVVIKRILPYLSRELEFVQMFLDEAKIAAQLHHPNIISVHELGKLDEQIFIAMEYVEGVDLRKILQEELKREGAVPYAIAAYITAQVSAGLHYAHNKIGRDGKPMGIIHRDISPQNVMVGFDGRVKLVDFGIAKAGALVERSKPGVIKGKFLYLSPEQLSQDRIDHRADIFALGTMIYEVTTGKSPFYKPTTEAVIYAIRAEEPPPPELVRPDYPPALSKIVTKCLQKDRTRRYQQAGEVQRDLEDFIRSHAPTGVQDIVKYVARLFGGEDERTALFIPPSAAEPLATLEDDKPPTQPTKPIRPLDGPKEPLPAYDEEHDPQTQMARPEEIARAFGDPLSTRPPARRPSGYKYQAAGASLDESTTTVPTGEGQRPTGEYSVSTSEPSTGANGRDRLAAPLGPVFDDGAGHAATLSDEPKTLPARPSNRLKNAFEDRDDRSTLDLRGQKELPPAPVADTVSVAQRERPPRALLFALGSGAVLLLAAVLFVWWLMRDSPAPPPPTPISVLPSPNSVPPIADVPAPADAGDESAPDAGQAEPPPSQKPTARAVVVFRAPRGTRIFDAKDRTPYGIGKKHTFLPGSHVVLYQCPAKRGKRPIQSNHKFTVAAQDGAPQEVSLPCRK